LVEEVEQQTLVVRRSGRARHQLDKYNPTDYCFAFLLTVIEGDPMSVKEVVDSLEGELWKEAMEEEMESLQNNDTCDLVKLPEGRKPIGSNWVSKKKTNATREVEKYKA